MGSSTKKKREKKKDFQKPKLKVGKAKPKADNHTATNFRAKAIVLNQQLNVEAPSTVQQFHHHLSLLSSKSDSQRKESLAFLTTYISSARKQSNLPVTIGALIDKSCPCILDGSNGVRSQVLNLCQAISPSDVQDQVPRILPHVRAGMTHLARDIRLSALDVLSWLIATGPEELVSSPGGWYSTLDSFTAMLAWRSSEITKWTLSKPAMGEPKSTAKIITILSEFLEAGLANDGRNENVQKAADSYPCWDLAHHSIPTKSNAYGYLNLFGTIRDQKTQMLEDREDRLSVYNDNFKNLIDAGVAACKKEGGEIGRATGLLSKVLERYAKETPH